MPAVLITPEAMLHQKAPYVDHLLEAGFEIRYPEDSTFTRGLCGPEKTVEVLSQCEAVIAGGEILTPAVLDALPKLRVVARSGVGYDRVDIPAATRLGIPVTITPTANHEAVAELTLSLIFAVAKEVLFNDREARAGRWPMKPTRPIRGQTLGIVGLGRIGRSTAVRGQALGMTVIAVESYPDQEFVQQHGIELVDLDTLLTRADFLSAHCPVTEETTGMFNAELFARMKPDSVFINTARGKLHVEADLIEALQNGPLWAAGLDVFEQEPTDAANPLFQLANVVCSPHVAGNDTKSQVDMGIEAADCIIRLHRGEWPAGAVVNDELRDGWTW